jgi:hypothetical protein
LLNPETILRVEMHQLAHFPHKVSGKGTYKCAYRGTSVGNVYFFPFISLLMWLSLCLFPCRSHGPHLRPIICLFLCLFELPISRVLFLSRFPSSIFSSLSLHFHSLFDPFTIPLPSLILHLQNYHTYSWLYECSVPIININSASIVDIALIYT